MKRKRLLGGLLALLMLFNIGSAFPMGVWGEGGLGDETSTTDFFYSSEPLTPLGSLDPNDVTTELEALLTLTINQGGSDISAGGQLDPTKPFQVSGVFGSIPLNEEVAGEGNWYLKKDNFAILEIARDVTLVDGADRGPHDLGKDKDGVTIGTLTFQNNSEDSSLLEAKIEFNPLLWAKEDSLAIENANFNATLEYAGDPNIDDEIDKTVTILGKTFHIYKSAVPTEPTISKTATLDNSTGIISWKVTVDAKKNGVPGKALEGIKFTDILPTGVTFSDAVTSFKVDGTSRTATLTTNKLEYAFVAADGDGPQDITYETKITNWDTVKYGFQEHKFENTAMAEIGSYKPTASDTITVPKKEWINKIGEKTTADGTKSDNPLDEYITWYIDVNKERYSLTNVTVTDKLNDGLTLVSAQWQIDTADEDAAKPIWADTGGKVTPTAENKYVYSGTTNEHLRLVIITKTNIADGSGYITDGKTFNNTASVTWDSFPGGGSVSGSAPGVYIGFHALNKEGKLTSDWKQKHLVEWEIKLNFNGHFSSGTLSNFAVYDLLIHEKEPSAKGDKPADNSIITQAVWEKLTPKYGQRYNATISATEGLYVKNTKIYNEAGAYVADLIKISNFDNDKEYSVKFSSKILDASSLTQNGTFQVHNTATLFENDILRKNAPATVSQNINVLQKSVLAAVADDSTLTGATAIGGSDNGFNHINKTAIFRLNINKDGQNLSDTDFKGKTSITITDTLPKGWEFDTTYNSGDVYKIFEGTTPTVPSPNPVSSVVFGDTGDRNTITFTFDKLDKHYVILIKAKLTDERYASLIEDKSPAPVPQTNDASLSGNNGPGATGSADVSVKTGGVTKTSTRLKDGVAKWVITYNPLEVNAVINQDKVFITDTFGPGFELFLDGNLNPDTTNEDSTPRFSIKEMKLNLDGTLEETVSNLASDWITAGKVTYNASNRKLIIELTEAEKTKAYQISYLTVLTGKIGDSFENSVVVEGVTIKKKADKSGFAIQSADASASLKLGGYLRINKVDKNDNVITGDTAATFTLSRSDNNKIIREGQSKSAILRFGALIPNTPANPYYILKETIPPTGGYVADSKEYKVVVTGTGENTTTTIYDEVGDVIIEFTPKLEDADKVFNIKNWKADDPKRPEYGDLTISKIAAGTLLDDTSKEYDFKLHFTESDGSNHSGKYVCLNNDGLPAGIIDIPAASGIVNLKLSHGESITIKNLLAGTKVTITEETDESEYIKTTYQIDGGVVQSGPTVTDIEINADSARVLDFFNDRKSGSLTLKKTAIGFFYDEDTTPFKFDLALTEGDGLTALKGTYSYSIKDLNDIAISSGSITPTSETDGIKKFDLKRSQSVTISNLPEDTKFFITETAGIDKYTVTTYKISNAGGEIRNAEDLSTKVDPSDPATDGITVNDDTLVTFKNVRNTDDLIISKEVIGSYPKSVYDPDGQLFEFTLELQDKFGADLTGSYTYSFSSDSSDKKTLTSHILNFKLAEDEFITIEKLPEDATFTITETYTGDKYTVTTHEIDNVESGADVATGLVGKGRTVAFTNTRQTGDLTLSKTVVGNLRDPHQKFVFTLNFTESGSTPPPHSGTYNYTASGTGNDIVISGLAPIPLPASGTITIPANGEIVIELEKDQSITIENIPQDIQYTITEEDYKTDRITTVHQIDAGSEVDGLEVKGNIKGHRAESKITFKNTRRPGTAPTDPPTTPVGPTVPTESIPTVPTTVPTETITGPTEPTGSTEATEPGPTEPTETTQPEPTYPTIPVDEVEDPNDPDSPDDFILIDDNGTPQGRYTKVHQPDGSYVYLDENGIPLGQRRVPRTGDQSNLILWVIMLTLSLGGAAWLLLPQLSIGRRKH